MESLNLKILNFKCFLNSLKILNNKTCMAGLRLQNTTEHEKLFLHRDEISTALNI